MSKEIWPAGWLAQRVKEHHERIRSIEERLWPRSGRITRHEWVDPVTGRRWAADDDTGLPISEVCLARKLSDAEGWLPEGEPEAAREILRLRRALDATHAVELAEGMMEEEDFVAWWDNYAIECRISLDTQMIKFAEAVRVSTLEEFVRRLKETS